MPKEYIMVQNLPPQATSHDLYLQFAKYGKIKSYNLKKNFLGGPALFQVQYSSAESARNAIQGMNRKRFKGQVLYVKNHEDRDYEDPINRTLVIEGLQRDLDFQVAMILCLIQRSLSRT